MVMVKTIISLDWTFALMCAISTSPPFLSLASELVPALQAPRHGLSAVNQTRAEMTRHDGGENIILMSVDITQH